MNIFRNKITLLITIFSLSLSSYAWGLDIPTPVATDSRIKTFVYSENDVFNLVTHYGYQSNVEFGANEEIETISVGDRVPFQIVPAGRRLFIRAMAANARTNMTVVTNKHAYQFDIASVPTPVMPNEELVYVVRFFYPGDKRNMPTVYADDARFAAAATQALPVQSSPAQLAPASGNVINNYQYTFSSSDASAPLKIFDDGSSTYFKLNQSYQGTPAIYEVKASGKEHVLTAHRQGDFWVVDTVASKFTIRQGTAIICIYNEKLSRP